MDCVAVTHVSDCCGQQRLTGLRATQRAMFQTLEALCDATYSACGCATPLPTTDDGSTLADGAAAAGVVCLKGTCTTFVSACHQPCAAGKTCGTCTKNDPKKTPYAACSSACASAADCTDHALPKCEAGSIGAMFCAAADVTCGAP